MGRSPMKGGHGGNFTWVGLLNIYVPSSYRALVSSSFHRSAFIDPAVIDVNIIPPLVVLVQNSEFDIKKEAARAISNATSGGSHEQLKYWIVTVCLEGLENILKIGEADKNVSNGCESVSPK
ncbi:unnamed protein product [Vicia faba]|uniref:Uncharacterized protein n=1 Tax=Vicia faba TaxID=3906 RepID=A0AAV0ZMN0_VICFA|nr:unnamed protein product [Vicia faba]